MEREIFMPHIGAWGTPDFGITEWISDKLGRQRTAQGGSNIFGKQPQETNPNQYWNWQSQASQENNPADKPSNEPTNSPKPSGKNSGNSGNGGNVNTKDPNHNPYGENGFWDAADGWKQKVTDASNEARAEQEALRNTINSQWDGAFNYLNQVGERLPSQFDAQNKQIADLFNSGSQKISDANALARSRIDSTRKTSLNGLADEYKQALLAANMHLGSGGASSSSANEMYKYALANAIEKQRGKIQMQANDQLATLDHQYKSQMASLDEWKNTKTYELGQWYSEAKNNLDYQRSQASGQRAQALAELDKQIYYYAMDRLRAIENQANYWKQTVDTWALERSGANDSAVLGLSNIPQAIQYDRVGFNPARGSNNTASTLLAGRQRIDDDEKARAGESKLFFKGGGGSSRGHGASGG